MTLKFIIPGNPVPWQAPQFSRKGTYDLKAQDKVSAIWHIKAQYFQGVPIFAAVEAYFIFYMPIAKSASKKEKEIMRANECYHSVKPDVSNLEKLYCDVLEKAGVLHNDSQIRKITAGKYYSDNPRIEITLTILKDKMPLIKSKSKKALGKNIKEEMETHPRKQAIAIGLSVARKAGAKIPLKKKK